MSTASKGSSLPRRVGGPSIKGTSKQKYVQNKTKRSDMRPSSTTLPVLSTHLCTPIDAHAQPEGPAYYKQKTAVPMTVVKGGYNAC